MSVIGRLDDQVDAVLIEPLKRSGQRKAESPAEVNDKERAPSSHSEAQAPDELESPRSERAVRAEELPVWLL